jgi:cation:H+ antiporter
MEILTASIILLLALVVLMASGHWIVRLLENISLAFGLSQFTTAFLLLAIATSIPELFLAISSAQQDAGGIVLAIALGSNIVNITLIASLAAVFSAGITTREKRLRQNIALSIAISIMPLFFLMDGVISRAEGATLLVAFAMYLIVLYRNKAPSTAIQRLPRHLLRGLGSTVLLLGLLVILLAAADKTVLSAVTIAEGLAISPFLIGLFLLAIGTSLPELTTTLHSARQKKPEMALGNILGSDAADSALIIGVASVIRPLHVPLEPHIIITAIFVFLANAALGYFALSRQRISITESLLLLGLFILFVFTMLLTTPAAFSIYH